MSCVTRLRLLSRVQHRQMLRIGLPFEPVGEYPREHARSAAPPTG